MENKITVEKVYKEDEQQLNFDDIQLLFSRTIETKLDSMRDDFGKPLSLLEKSNQYFSERTSLIKKSTSDLIQDGIAQKIKDVQNRRKLKYKREEHSKSSNEELLGFLRNQVVSPITSGKIELPKEEKIEEPVVGLKHSSQTLVNQIKLQQRNVQHLEERKIKLERELQRCIIQQQILSNKILRKTKMEVQVENSKLDIGLNKLLINNAVLSNCLSQQGCKKLMMHYEVSIVGGQVFQSDKIPESKIRPQTEWNQSFSFTLSSGIEQIQIRIMISSIAIGQVELDCLLINLDEVLPKLGDQKLRQIVYLSEKETALEVVMKWRYDDTQQKLHEVQKRMQTLRLASDSHNGKIKGAKTKLEQLQQQKQDDDTAQIVRQETGKREGGREVVKKRLATRSKNRTKSRQTSQKSKAISDAEIGSEASPQISTINNTMRLDQQSYISSKPPVPRMPSFSSQVDFQQPGGFSFVKLLHDKQNNTNDTTLNLDNQINIVQIKHSIERKFEKTQATQFKVPVKYQNRPSSQTSVVKLEQPKIQGKIVGMENIKQNNRQFQTFLNLANIQSSNSKQQLSSAQNSKRDDISVEETLTPQRLKSNPQIVQSAKMPFKNQQNSSCMNMSSQQLTIDRVAKSEQKSREIENDNKLIQDLLEINHQQVMSFSDMSDDDIKLSMASDSSRQLRVGESKIQLQPSAFSVKRKQNQMHDYEQHDQEAVSPCFTGEKSYMSGDSGSYIGSPSRDPEAYSKYQLKKQRQNNQHMGMTPINELLAQHKRLNSQNKDNSEPNTTTQQMTRNQLPIFNKQSSVPLYQQNVQGTFTNKMNQLKLSMPDSGTNSGSERTPVDRNNFDSGQKSCSTFSNSPAKFFKMMNNPTMLAYQIAQNQSIMNNNSNSTISQEGFTGTSPQKETTGYSLSAGVFFKKLF